MTRGQLIEVTTPDGVAEAYVTGPATQERPVPGVLFFMDAIGVRPRIQEMADRIADWGDAEQPGVDPRILGVTGYCMGELFDRTLRENVTTEEAPTC